MNKYMIINDHNNFLHILVCVALLHSMAPARWGQDKAVAPPWKIVNFFCHIGGLFATFFSLGGGGFIVCFFDLAPPPYENFCGRPCYTISINFLVTIDTYAKNEPTIDCLGGGVHGKVCWLIAYILLQWCVNGIGHSVAHCYNK